MVPSQCDGDHRAPCIEGDAHGCAAVRGGVGAELPVPAEAPALERGVVEYCACVRIADSERGDRPAGTQVHTGRAAAVGSVAQTELSVAIPSPALERAVV